jgi:cardiolipin synthase
MTDPIFLAAISVGLHLLVQGTLAVQVLLRPHRDPAARVAWLVVILAMPILGLIAYILLGGTSIGRARAARRRSLVDSLAAVVGPATAETGNSAFPVPERHAHLFRTGQAITGFVPVDGNTGALMEDSDATIDAIIVDIDAARDHVHLLFYIWLPDNNGRRVAEALERAAARGVVCRAMADDLGSRLMIRSGHWRAMQAAGVHLGRALPIGNPLLRVLRGRIDLRNHRKIVVIDDRITYCGSQNCADPAFLVKAKYAPWVDAMIRFEGPIARQNQILFAADWMAHTAEDLGELLRRPVAAAGSGLPAQVIGTGPTMRWSAMPEMFEALIYAARHELTITTPYYVPDESMQSAICAAARRGVLTTVVFPARNDSWVVAAASRSYYADLLAAGVRIYEYVGGLLHTKSLTLDGEITLIGSANMDRRSFELNFENNILFCDRALTAAVRRRQDSYVASAVAVSADQVAGWGRSRRLWNNAVATLGPVL